MVALTDFMVLVGLVVLVVEVGLELSKGVRGSGFLVVVGLIDCMV